MTTVLAIVQQAYRESNLLAITQTLDSNREAEGLAKLNWVIASALGSVIGEPLVDWPVGTAGVDEFAPNWNSTQWSKPPPNSRLVVNLTTDETISLPPVPSNGARLGFVDTAVGATRTITLDGNGRLIEGDATLPVAAGSAYEWLYQADTGNWARVVDLLIGDEMPFPKKYDGYFEMKTALRLNPRMGRTMDPQAIYLLGEAESQLKAEYGQYVPKAPDPGAVRRSNGEGGSCSPVQPFRRGRYGWMV